MANAASSASLRASSLSVKIARAIGFLLLGVSAIYFVLTAWRYAGELPPIDWSGATVVRRLPTASS